MSQVNIVYHPHFDSIDKHGRPVPATIVKSRTIGSEVGFGIFAGDDIPENTHMGWYYGEVYYEYPDNGSNHILEVERRPCWVPKDIWEKRFEGQGMFIDGKMTIECSYGLVRSVGDGIFIEGNASLGGGVLYRFSMLNHDAGDKANVKFLKNGRVVALKNINKGDELFLNYGQFFLEEDE